MLQLLTTAGDRVRGTAVVGLTTGTPSDATAIASRAEALGGRYLDGAMMFGPAAIGQPEAMIMFSGDRTVFDDHRDLLTALAPASVFLGDDPATAARYDAALLALLYATYAGWLHAFTLATADGSPATDLVPYAEAWFNHLVAHVGGAELADDTDRRTYADNFGSSLALNAKGLAVVGRAFAETGLDGEMFTRLARLADQRVADGHGADGFNSLIEAIRRPVHRRTVEA